MIIKNKQKSFTLIELLVVIVIIGILAGVIMISTSSSIDKANFAKAQAFSSTIKNELLLDLISEWKFDEGSGQIVYDTWGGHNGILGLDVSVASDDPIWITNDCISNSCLKFDGGDKICIADSNDLEMTNIQTIALWVNQSGGSTFFNKPSDTWTNTLYLGRAGNKIQFYVSDQLKYSTQTINLNRWNYIVAIFNKSTNIISFYINGIKDPNQSYTGTLGESSKGLVIGADRDGETSYNDYFYGIMDEINLYKKILSSFQIKQNYIAGLNSLLANSLISKQEYNERINALAYDN
jgi:prepilin-type N-terminal cleavage/methylation domain-containing protein